MAYKQAIQSKLYALLTKRTAKYTLNDSTSLPVELAEELLNAVCYVLGFEADISEKNAAVWAEMDFDLRFSEGIRCIQKKMVLCRKLWRTAFKSLPRIENTSLADTMQSIKNFEDRYDYHFFAHQIPCDVDYQLCIPVPENVLGVDFLIEWLTRLIIENQLINSFDHNRSIEVLEQHSPDYKGLLINLYDPIAANALFKILSGGGVYALIVTEEERCAVAKLIQDKKNAESARLMEQAAKRLTEVLGIHSIRAREYLNQQAVNLIPRLKAVATALTVESSDAIIDEK